MTLENIAGELQPTETKWTDDSSSGGLGDSSSGGSSNKSPVYKNLPIDGKISVMENTTHVIDVDAIDDYDSEGNGLKYFIVGGADKDLYKIDQHTGKLSFINAPDYENPLDAHKNNIYDVVVRVVDSHGAYTDQSLWVHVTDKPDSNNAPHAVDDHYTVMEGGDINLKTDPSKGLLSNDSDPDGDTLSIKAVNGQEFTDETSVIEVEGSNGGKFTVLENGGFKFWAGEGFEDLNAGETRDTSITYTVDDGNGGMDTATVKVTVTGKDDVPSGNKPPVAVDDHNSTAPGQKVGTEVLNNDTDPDGDPLRIKSFTQAANGTVKLNNNGTIDDKTDDKLVYFPDAGFTGTDTFTYTIDDGNGGMDTATVKITVGDDGTGGGDNQPPVAVDDHNSTAPGQKVGTQVLNNDSDPDGDPLRIKSFTQAENGTVKLNNNGTPTDKTDDKLVYTPNEGFTGIDTFTYAVADPSGAMDMATVKITVGDDGTGGGDNKPPVAVDDHNSTTPGQKVGTSVLANDSDPDGDPLRIKSFTQAENGTVKLNNNGTPTDKTDDKLVYTPNEGFTGIDTFTYAVADPSGAMDMATVKIEVGAGNNAPLAVDDYNTTKVGQKVGTSVLANDSDPDGDPLRIKSFTQAENGTVKLNNNGTPTDKTDDKLVYFPNEGFVGTDTFTYAVADPSGAMDMATVKIDVIDPNPTPKITAELVGTTSIHEGDQGTYKIQLDYATDRDRTFTIEVKDGTANRVDQYAANQDIIWGGFYDIRNSDGEVLKVVKDRVPNGTRVSDGDRPAFGPGDASWDYTVYQDNSINTGSTITVTVPAGETMSDTFEVQTWLEQVTVDRDGPNSKGFLEGKENFSVKVVGTDNTMFSQDSLQVEIIDKTDYGFVSPIAIDLDGDGIQTISINQSVMVDIDNDGLKEKIEGVRFDMDNDGVKEKTGWLSGGDGFLAIDKVHLDKDGNEIGRGLIESQDELFGGAGAGEAFEKLASYDSDGNGLVNADDVFFNEIKVWRDANQNGLTDSGELRSLHDFGVSELNINYESNSIIDSQGNVLGETSTAVVNDKVRDLVDVYFDVKEV